MSRLFTKTAIPYPSDIQALTSLRFLASLMVLFFHFFQINPNGPLIRFFSGGYLWVDFFFILSGFILTHAYARKFDDKSVSYKQFCIKRLARIYPIHLFVLLAVIALSALLPAFNPEHLKHPYRDFIANIFLVHSWGFTSEPGYNTPSWSISAEWFAYLLFPFILGFFKKPETFFVATLTFMLCVWGVLKVGFSVNLTDISWSLGIIRILPAFVFGMALYKIGCKYSLCVPVAFNFPALLFILFAIAAISPPPVICSILFGALILIYAEKNRKQQKTILDTPIAIWLGQISYAFYMIHFVTAKLTVIYLTPLLKALMPIHIAVIMTYACTVIACVIAAAAIHHVVENPSRKALLKAAT